jgi:excisionase family DNA binding protein
MRLTKDEEIKLAREGYETLIAQFPKAKEKAKRDVGRNSKRPRGKAVSQAARSEDPSETISLTIGGGSENKTLSLPRQAIEALTKILGHLSKGQEVRVTAEPTHLTTQQAADFLHVSRPFLVGLLEKGEIPFHKVGTHRRVRFADLEAYKESVGG